ncbi:MAG: hypothetical protein AMJ55_00260 [Gammaproteobacteria bacterium SG8_15]|nr:MAG: hypothetical protein AMJ55_00260 [Gammaproteobacteria bacterium SG8_15]
MSEAGPNDAQEKLEAEAAQEQVDAPEIAYGVTLYMTTEGQYGAEPINDIPLLDMLALLARATEGARSQFYAMRTAQFQQQMLHQQQQHQHSNLVVPKPGIQVVGE